MRHLIYICAVLAFMAPAFAAVPPETPDIKAVESYLNGISTLRARFVQKADDGKKMEGIFLLKRPGKMRFEYAPPMTDFIVADGFFVYYYDGQMKQQSNVPIRNSLADFFLRKRLSLSGDITVSEISRKGGLLQVTVQQTNHPEAGLLTIGFQEKPMQLKKWRIVDEQGLTTEVELFDIETGIALKNSLFHYYDPQPKINE